MKKVLGRGQPREREKKGVEKETDKVSGGGGWHGREEIGQESGWTSWRGEGETPGSLRTTIAVD